MRTPASGRRVLPGVSSALCALGLLGLLSTSCLPIRNTPRRPLTTVVRPGPRPVVARLMVAILPAEVTQARAGERAPQSGASKPRVHGPGVSELTGAVRRSGVARVVVESPVNGVDSREVLLAAKSAGALHLVTFRRISMSVRRGHNGHFAWSLTVGAILLPLLPLFYYLAPHQTLHVTTRVEVALWLVGERRRVWNRQVSGEAYVTSAPHALRRRLDDASRLAVNAAYRRALPALHAAVRSWIQPPAPGKTGAVGVGS